ncbi:Ig-like domain-containing protein [Brevibacillus borstelensis]|uniref:Ig-like domain-containing protein n=1 Tax=Brevibacillus borstelensis TaxID=45462 RepID=UPI0035CCEC93
MIVGYGIPDVVFPHNSKSELISLTDYFSDPDGDNLTITVAIESGTGIVYTFNYIIGSPTYGTIVFHAKDGISSHATIIVTANDGKGGTVNDRFEVSVS